MFYPLAVFDYFLVLMDNDSASGFVFNGKRKFDGCSKSYRDLNFFLEFNLLNYCLLRVLELLQIYFLFVILSVYNCTRLIKLITQFHIYHNFFFEIFCYGRIVVISDLLFLQGSNTSNVDRNISRKFLKQQVRL